MKLYIKILIAFALVIAIAVSAVAVAGGRLVELEFRSYNARYSNRSQRTSQSLIDYYVEHGSWIGLQNYLTEITPGGKGHGQGQMGNTFQGGNWPYRVADASGRIVANIDGDISGSLTKNETRGALPLEIDGDLIGYMAMSGDVPLEQPAMDFLKDMQNALWFGIAIAILASLLTAGILTRGFVAPIQNLTKAAEAISDGNLDSRVFISGNDEITQLAQSFNKMADTIQKAENNRKAQTADIAHELRNPLAILQGSLEALADGVYAPSPGNIEPALDQVKTLNRLVEDLRILALADAGGLRLNKQAIDLNMLVSRVVDAHRESFERHAVQFEFDLHKSVPAAMADYNRLTQVINNTVGNALRYVGAGGKVSIVTSTQDDGIVLSVMDNGPGVPPQDLPHIFERFWRGDPSRSRETGGSGLGLTIARQIIEAHHGRIWAETTPGGGLTVRFWLPLL